MNNILTTTVQHVCTLTFNKIHTHNAFDAIFLQILYQEIQAAIANPDVYIIQLKANGKHFSAGADIQWMQTAINYNKEENIADAMHLARVLYALYTSPKPIVTVVHGASFGGGAGIIAASDLVIAATSATFCFPEVKLGLIPALISPYVIQAIGARNAKWFFLTTEIFDAATAKAIGLVQHCVPDELLDSVAAAYIRKLTVCVPKALTACKLLIDDISNQPITDALLLHTATLIAQQRVSPEGQQGLKAFLDKDNSGWN